MLHTTLSDFVAVVAPEVTLEHGDEWAYYSADEKIVWHENEDLTDFMTDLRTRTKYVDSIPILLWALLHEIGHHFTEDVEGDRFAYALITLFGHTRKHYRAYYNLPEEKAATDWAIEFVENKDNKEILESMKILLDR